MNSKSGTIPKQPASTWRRNRLPSSDSEKDIENNNPCKDGKNTSRMSKRNINFPIASYLDYDLAEIEINKNNDLKSSNNSAINLTTTKLTQNQSFENNNPIIEEKNTRRKSKRNTNFPIASYLDYDLTEIEINKNNDLNSAINFTATKLTQNHSFDNINLDINYEESITMAELNEMIEKYGSGKPSAAEVGKAALLASQNKSKPCKLKDNIIDLRNEALAPGAKRSCASKQTLAKMVKSSTADSLPSVTLSQSVKITVYSNVQQNLDIGNLARMKRAPTTEDSVTKKKSTSLLSCPVKNPAVVSNSQRTTFSKAFGNRIMGINSYKPAKGAIRAVVKKSACVNSTCNKRLNHQTSTVGTSYNTTKSTARVPSTKTTVVKRRPLISRNIVDERVKTQEVAIKKKTIPDNLQATSSAVNATDDCTEIKKNIAPTPTSGLMLECPVCFELLLLGRPTVLTACGHMFCRSCMDDLQCNARCNGTNISCPICRVALTQVIDIHV